MKTTLEGLGAMLVGRVSGRARNVRYDRGLFSHIIRFDIGGVKVELRTRRRVALAEGAVVETAGTRWNPFARHMTVRSLYDATGRRLHQGGYAVVAPAGMVLGVAGVVLLGMQNGWQWGGGQWNPGCFLLLVPAFRLLFKYLAEVHGLQAIGRSGDFAARRDQAQD